MDKVSSAESREGRWVIRSMLWVKKELEAEGKDMGFQVSFCADELVRRVPSLWVAVTGCWL